MVQFHEATQVAYAQIAVISVDPPPVSGAFKAGLGAKFPFFSDPERQLTDALGIRETTDRKHGPLPVPFTFAILPDRTIHRVFNGWYMAGRPTPQELRETLRAMTAIARDDFQFAGD